MINIDLICKNKKVTKTEVATRMGLTRERLHKILKGNPTLANISKIADALGVPIQEIFEPPKQPKVKCPACGEILTLQFV